MPSALKVVLYVLVGFLFLTVGFKILFAVIGLTLKLAFLALLGFIVVAFVTKLLRA